MRQRERTRHGFVHADELDRKPDHSREHQIPPEHDAVRDAPIPPADEQPRHRQQQRQLVELRRVDWNIGRRQAFGNATPHGKSVGPAVVVADKKTTDAADAVTEREAG